jgi:hypothetical protein
MSFSTDRVLHLKEKIKSLYIIPTDVRESCIPVLDRGMERKDILYFCNPLCACLSSFCCILVVGNRVFQWVFLGLVLNLSHYVYMWSGATCRTPSGIQLKSCKGGSWAPWFIVWNTGHKWQMSTPLFENITVVFDRKKGKSPSQELFQRLCLFVFFLLHVSCWEQGLPMSISGSGIEFITNQPAVFNMDKCPLLGVLHVAPDHI